MLSSLSCLFMLCSKPYLAWVHLSLRTTLSRGWEAPRIRQQEGKPSVVRVSSAHGAVPTPARCSVYPQVLQTVLVSKSLALGQLPESQLIYGDTTFTFFTNLSFDFLPRCIMNDAKMIWRRAHKSAENSTHNSPHSAAPPPLASLWSGPSCESSDAHITPRASVEFPKCSLWPQVTHCTRTSTDRLPAALIPCLPLGQQQWVNIGWRIQIQVHISKTGKRCMASQHHNLINLHQ